MVRLTLLRLLPRMYRLSQHGVDRLGRLIEVGLGKALLRSIGVTAASNSSSLSSRTSP